MEVIKNYIRIKYSPKNLETKQNSYAKSRHSKIIGQLDFFEV